VSKSKQIRTLIKSLESEFFTELKKEAKEFFEQNKNKWFERNDEFFKFLEVNPEGQLIALKFEATYRGWEVNKICVDFVFDELKEVNPTYYKFGVIREYFEFALNQLPKPEVKIDA
jgi:hypothetical protein